MREVVGCSVCHRAVYEEHVDKKGQCVFCREEPEAPRSARTSYTAPTAEGEGDSGKA